MNTYHFKTILCGVCVSCGFVAALTSCSDYLEEDNKTGSTADLTYNTVTGIDGLIQSAYSYTH